MAGCSDVVRLEFLLLPLVCAGDVIARLVSYKVYIWTLEDFCTY